MNPHVKSLILMVTTQACCVVLGLQLHDSYLRASVENAEAAAATTDEAAGETLNQVQPIIRVLSIGWIVAMQVMVGFVTLSRMHRQVKQETDELRIKALTRERQVRQTRDALIFGLATLAESRDPRTGQHLERISLYSTRLATELYRRGLFKDILTREFLRTIGSSSTLHDIGKVSVRDDVLRKPGALTAEEREHIQTHTVAGGECIRAVEAQTGNSHFLRMAHQIALYHHERWDGTGYPQRLVGESIPLAARIVAIADVYDALSVKRTYKSAVPHQQCVETIAAGAGTQFDPRIVEAFLAVEAEFADIAMRHTPADVPPRDVDSDRPATAIPIRPTDTDPEDEVLPLTLLLGNLQSQVASRSIAASETTAAESPT